MEQYYQVIIRLPKEDSVLLYFTLEANEGICFYSTLDYEKGTTHRDVEIMGDPKLYLALKNILKHLTKQITFTTIRDCPCL